jgi:hypothetical protein
MVYSGNETIFNSEGMITGSTVPKVFGPDLHPSPDTRTSQPIQTATSSLTHHFPDSSIGGLLAPSSHDLRARTDNWLCQNGFPANSLLFIGNLRFIGLIGTTIFFGKKLPS